MGVVFTYIKETDERMSNQIMQISTSTIMEYTLWMPFHAFKLYGYPFLIMIMIFIFPQVELELNKEVENILELEQDERLNYDAMFVLAYYAVSYIIVFYTARGL